MFPTTSKRHRGSRSLPACGPLNSCPTSQNCRWIRALGSPSRFLKSIGYCEHFTADTTSPRRCSRRLAHCSIMRTVTIRAFFLYMENGMRNINSACRSLFADGCWTRTISKPAPTIFSTIPTSASPIFSFPITVDGALIQGWELTLQSPTLWHFGQAHLAYSNQLAQQRGDITGGLVCIPITAPQCDSGYNYVPLDHDQTKYSQFWDECEFAGQRIRLVQFLLRFGL